MNTRQQKILEAVIKGYVNTAQPVSSGILNKKYGLKTSPATIRAEMKRLEEEGYLYQPYTSAGRIPTDKGYRFFINSLMRNKELSLREQEALQQNFLKNREISRLMPKIAGLLADMSSNLAISGLLDFDEPEFHKAGAGRLLREPEFGDGNQIAEILDYLDRNIEELFDIAQDETIGIYPHTQKTSAFKPGTNNQPMDSSSERTHSLGMGVRVYIGQENPIKQMKGLSMIVSGQRLKSGNRGLIAILGPLRMRYDRNIALVEYIRDLLENI